MRYYAKLMDPPSGVVVGDYYSPNKRYAIDWVQNHPNHSGVVLDLQAEKGESLANKVEFWQDRN